MELTPYLEGLRRDLAAAAAPGGPGIEQAANLLAGSLGAWAVLSRLEALGDAGPESPRGLPEAAEPAGGVRVEVGLRGGAAQWVISEPAPRPAAAPAPPTEIPDSGDLARITLRL